MISTRHNEYEPDSVTPPGETLADTLDALGMSQAELSERLGRHRKTVNEIIKDKQRIMPDTALELERVLGVPASFWLNRQGRYDEFLARRAFQEHLKHKKNAYQEWVKRIPHREMASLGWIPSSLTGGDLIRALLAFFGVASLDQWRTVWSRLQVAFLKTGAFKQHSEILAAWLRQGERMAQSVEVSPYDSRAFKKCVENVRRMVTHQPSNYLRDVPKEFAAAGVTLLYVPQLSNLRVYGATRWLTGRPIIQLSLLRKQDHYFWFTLFHEAYHILEHGRTQIFIESDDSDSSKGDSQNAEEEANLFAQDKIIPARQWTGFVKEFCSLRHRSIYVRKSRVVAFAKGMNVCPGVVVARLQREKILPYNHMNDLKKSLDSASHGDQP